MCHRCRTIDLCRRLRRQVDNIDKGGSISADAIRGLLFEAGETLARYQNASATFEMVMDGAKPVSVSIQPDEIHPEGGGSKH